MKSSPEERASAADREFAEWAKTMRTTPALLWEAAQSVGIAPRKIRLYLRDRSRRADVQENPEPSGK